MTVAGRSVVELNDRNFAELVERSSGVAMVDFGADWCGPCRMMAPIVERLATEYQDRIIIGALDVDANPEVSARLGIRNLPTFLFFRDGKLVDGLVGAVPERVLSAKIQEQLQAS